MVLSKQKAQALERLELAKEWQALAIAVCHKVDLAYIDADNEYLELAVHAAQAELARAEQELQSALLAAIALD